VIDVLCSANIEVALEEVDEFSWTFVVRSYDSEGWSPRADVMVTSGDVQLSGEIRVVDRTEPNTSIWFSIDNSNRFKDLSEGSELIITGTVGKGGPGNCDKLIATNDLYGRQFADMVFVASGGEETKLHREILSHALMATPDRVTHRWTPPWASSERNSGGLAVMKFPVPHDVVERYVEILYKGITPALLRSLDLVKLVQIADELEDSALIEGVVRLVQPELLSTWRGQILALTDQGAQTEALKLLRKQCVDEETNRVKERLCTMQRTLEKGVPYELVSRIHDTLDQFERGKALKKQRTE